MNDLHNIESFLFRPCRAGKRGRIKKKLGLPEHIGANAMLDALNLMLTREEFLELTQGEDQ